MSCSLEQWMWQLECIEKEFARLPPEPRTYNVFVVGRDVIDVDMSRIGCLRFPWSSIETLAALATPQGILCVDLAVRGQSRLMRWKLDRSGLSHWTLLEDWPADPPGGTSTWIDGGIDWNVFYCIGAQDSSWREIVFPEGRSGWDADHISHLECALLSCCRDAPQAILERLGDLSELGDLPTCLLYLALRQAHPLLSVWGDVWPQPARGRNRAGPLNRRGCIVLPRCQRYIILKPDYLTAVKYLFDTLRHTAGSRVGDADQRKERTGEAPTPPTGFARPTTLVDRFTFGFGQTLYDDKDLELAPGFRTDVFHKLVKSYGRTVGYQTLHSDSDVAKASDQLRGAVSAINKALLNGGAPCRVVNRRGSGYLLR